MRKILIPVCALALSTACFGQSKKKAPNVLFILVDDMQSTCIHAYGCDQVYSPNIDRIVDNGVSFTRTYTNGSLGGALSMPSRAMIMTGRNGIPTINPLPVHSALAKIFSSEECIPMKQTGMSLPVCITMIRAETTVRNPL